LFGISAQSSGYSHSILFLNSLIDVQSSLESDSLKLERVAVTSDRMTVAADGVFEGRLYTCGALPSMDIAYRDRQSPLATLRVSLRLTPEVRQMVKTQLAVR
jgi:hypothetical protein